MYVGFGGACLLGAKNNLPSRSRNFDRRIAADGPIGITITAEKHLSLLSLIIQSLSDGQSPSSTMHIISSDAACALSAGARSNPARASTATRWFSYPMHSASRISHAPTPSFYLITFSITIVAASPPSGLGTSERSSMWILASKHQAREKARRNRGVVDVIDAKRDFRRGHSESAVVLFLSGNNRSKGGALKHANVNGDLWINLENNEKAKLYKYTREFPRQRHLALVAQFAWAHSLKKHLPSVVTFSVKSA